MIRYAEPGDAEAIARLQVRTSQAAYRGMVPDEWLDGRDPEELATRWSAMLTNPDERLTVLILEVGDEMAGIAHLGPAQGEPSSETGELRLLNIAPEHQGHGQGRRLLAAAAEELRWAGFGQAIAWVIEGNQRARRFYERAGWAHDGGDRAEVDRGSVIHEVRFRRPIPDAPMALRFDKATPDDIDELLRLGDDLARWMIERGIEQWRPGEVPAGRIRHYVVDGETTVLRYCGEVVAAVTVKWEEPWGWDDSLGVAGYVHRLMVDRSLAGQGLGRRLLQRAERRIFAGGHHRARLDCESGNAFLRRYYERAGYRQVGETDFGGRAPRMCALYEKRFTAPPAARA